MDGQPFFVLSPCQNHSLVSKRSTEKGGERPQSTIFPVAWVYQYRCPLSDRLRDGLVVVAGFSTFAFGGKAV